MPNIFLDIIRNQFRVLQTWMDPILKLSEVFPEADGLKKAAQATQRNYDKLIKQIGETPTDDAGLATIPCDSARRMHSSDLRSDFFEIFLKIRARFVSLTRTTTMVVTKNELATLQLMTDTELLTTFVRFQDRDALAKTCGAV